MLIELLTGSINDAAMTWAAAMQAALIQGVLTLAIVTLAWALLRQNMSHAFAHGLFLIVPIKTVAAALFVICPAVIAFQVPVPRAVMETIKRSDEIEVVHKLSMKQQMQSLDDLVESTKIAATANDVGALIEKKNIGVGAVRVGEVSAVAVKAGVLSNQAWLMLVWAGSVLVLLLIFMIRHIIVFRRLKLTTGASQVKHQKLVEGIAAEIGLRRVPRVCETRGVATPGVIGIWRPRLLIPSGFFQDFGSDEIRWALLHELAHVKRRDLWSLGFERIVGLCFFFDPALWVARRATRLLRELACDDLAKMQSGLSAKTCAHTFLKLIEDASRRATSQSTFRPELSLSNPYPSIQKRIMNMTAHNRNNQAYQLSKHAFAGIAIFTLIASLPFAPRLVAQAPALGGVKTGTVEEKKPSGEVNEMQLAQVVIGQNSDEKADSKASEEDVSAVGGKVIDEQTGKPIAAAEVMLIYMDGKELLRFQSLKPVNTNEQGLFQIGDLPKGNRNIALQVVKKGYAAVHVDLKNQAHKFTEFAKKAGVVKLHKGLLMKGKVLDPDGKPLADVQVAHAPELYLNDYHQTKTDTNGEFVFDNFNKDRPSHVLYAKKPGYGTATVKIERADAFRDEVILKMEQPRSVVAFVSDEQGKPLAGVDAEIRLFMILNGEYRVLARSDERGMIKVDDLPRNKDIALQIYHPGFAFHQSIIKTDDLAEQKITLLKGVDVSGTVQNRVNNQPIEQFKLTIVPEKERSLLISTTEFDHFRNGRFRISNSSTSPERFKLVFSAGGFRAFETQSYSINDCPLKLDVKLSPIPVQELPHYRGKVVSVDGKPAAMAKIGLFMQSDLPLLRNSEIYATRNSQRIPQTDEQGNFDFYSTEPVTEMLVLHESGAIYQTMEPNTDFNSIVLKLQPYGRLAGSIKRDGKPDSKSLLMLYYGFTGKGSFSAIHGIPIDAEGNFHFDKLIPGKNYLNYELAGIPKNSQTNLMIPFFVKPGETVRFDRDLQISDGPRRDVVGKMRFVDRARPADLSGSMISLNAPEGNALRLSAEVPYLNSESRLKYLETVEGKALNQALEEFYLLPKEVSANGEFRIKGVPVGQFELGIWAGNLNARFGSIKKVIDVKPAKPGEENQPIDLGEVDVIQPSQRPKFVGSKEPQKQKTENVK